MIHLKSAYGLFLLTLGTSVVVAPSAAAEHAITFTGEFEGSFYFSTRFDGTTYFNEDLPPLFDVARLDGGSFSASFVLPQIDPIFPGAYDFVPSIPLTFTLYDTAGEVVHRGVGSITEAGVQNDAEGRDPRSPRTDSVSFDGAIEGDASGLSLPPESYGPNAVQESYFLLDFGTRFVAGGGPIDDLSIPLDGDTYLAFDGRSFGLYLMIGNGVADGPDPFLYVYTSLSYTVTGASVAPSAVPEPGGLALLGTAFIALAAVFRRPGGGAGSADRRQGASVGPSAWSGRRARARDRASRNVTLNPDYLPAPMHPDLGLIIHLMSP